MSIILALLLSLRLPSTTQKPKSLKEGYDVLSLEPASGNYVDSEYLNAHKIPTSSFSATSNGDDDRYPLSNAFDDDLKTFWLSKEPESSSFHPSIFINFNEPVLFEALLFNPIYRTAEPVRYYDGFPHKLKIYTALNDEPLELNAVFIGDPVYPATTIQFVLPKPVKISRLQIEFCEVSEATFFETTKAQASTEGIILLQAFDHDVVYYESRNGKYTNSNFIKYYKIPYSSFTPTTTGDREGYPISYAFDENNDNSWVSNQPETETFHPSIFIDFHKTTFVDAFLYVVKSHKKLTKKYLDGFPSSLYVYTAMNDEPYKLHTVFIGTPSTDNLDLQYVFKKPVECTKIQIEFHDVSQFEDGEKLAATDEITLIQSFNVDTIYYGDITGNFANPNYANFHKIDPSKITAGSTGDRDGNPASYAFDMIQSTSWISKDVETDTFHPSLFATFDEPVLLDAFVFDVKSQKDWKGTRYFDGFPSLIALYTAMNDEPLKLNTVFIGTADTNIVHFLYTLAKPVECTKVQIEFHDVSQFNRKDEFYAATDGITFYQNLNEETLSCSKVNGDYDNPNYVEYHKIQPTKFTAISNGDRDGNPITNAFDDDTGTLWVAKDVQSDTFNPSITVDFNEPVLLEAFLYDVNNHKKLTTWYLDGYPYQVVVYTALNDDSFKLHSVFLGAPGASDSRSQYVFSSPVKCSKVKLVFYDISDLNGGSKLVSTKGITFLQSFVEDPVRFEQATGIYTDSYYVNSRTVQTTSFTVTSNGDDNNHPLSSIFNTNNNEYWLSNRENSDDFKSSLTFSFPNGILLEAFLIYTTSGNGYPLRLNVYSSENDEPLALKVEFAGIPTNSWNSIQFVLPTPIQCSKLKLEFVHVTNKKATITQLTLIQNLDYKYLSFGPASGFYSNDHYIETHKVPISNMNISSTGHREEYKIENAFDNDVTSIWISSFENTDEKHAKIFVDFAKTINLEAIVINARKYSKWPNNYIVGFPQKLKINASFGNEYYSALFTGSTDSSQTKYQFVLPAPVHCSHLEFDLSDITDEREFSGSKKVALIPGINIIAEEVFDYSQGNFTDDLTSIHINTSFISDEITGAAFVNISLPKNDEYLFYVEKDFHFENVSFLFIQNKMSAIKTIDVPHVIIEKCSFIKCTVKNEQDFGGAVNFINAGINCGRSDFINCKSSRGGGIFIHLNKPLQDTLKIERCNFLKCSAVNGGGCYFYSNHKSNSITINGCKFMQNTISETKTVSKDGIPPGSGSAIFMLTLKATVRRCQFVNNEGASAFSILNSFIEAAAEVKKSKGRFFQLFEEESVLISDCKFEINQKAKSSLYYISGSNGVHTELRKSVFTGKLQNGAHHIDGKSTSSESWKLFVKTCKFAHSSQNSLNCDPSNSFLSIDLKGQQFDFNEKTNESKVSWKPIVALVVLFVVFVVIAIVVIVVKLKKKPQNDQSDDNEMSAEKRDLLLDQSLI